MVGEDVVIRLHRTDILIYKPDDTIIINNGGYATPTTHDALSVISPFSVCGHQNQTWVGSSFVLSPNGSIGRGIFLPLRDNTPEEFKVVEIEGVKRYVRVTPLFPVVHSVNRKAANRVRSRYKAFWNYSLNALKLLGKDGRFSRETYKEVLGYYERLAPHLYQARDWMLSEDTEDYFRALLSMFNPRGEHTEEVFREAFNNLTIRLHADEVLEAKTVTTGNLVTDRYKSYTK